MCTLATVPTRRTRSWAWRRSCSTPSSSTSLVRRNPRRLANAGRTLGCCGCFVLIWLSVCPGTPEHRYQVTALLCRSPTNARAAHVSRSFYFGKRISVFAQILFSLKLICAASRSADALQFSGALPQGGGRLPGQGGAAVRQLPHGACPARLRHAEVLLLSDSRGSRVCSQQARQSPFC